MAPVQKGKRLRDDLATFKLDTISEINSKTVVPLNAVDTLVQFKALAAAIWKGEEQGDDATLQRSLKEAAAFLLACTINTSTTSFRIIEVESYFLGGAGCHNDTFTHAFPEQGTVGEWYFHRVTPGGGFKGGTFKGMDITFGNGTQGGKHFGGFLIRSILHVGVTPLALVEGPSLVVDKLLSSASCPTVSEFVSTRGVVSIATSPMTLTYQPDKCSAGENLCTSPRVGLVPRKPTDLVYAGRPYRFHVINPTSIPSLAKVRSGIVSALVAKGVSSDSLSLLTGGQKQLTLKLESIVSPFLSEPLCSELKFAIEAAVVSQLTHDQGANTHSSKSAAASIAEKVTSQVLNELGETGTPQLQILKEVLGCDVKEATVIAKLVAIAASQKQY